MPSVVGRREQHDLAARRRVGCAREPTVPRPDWPWPSRNGRRGRSPAGGSTGCWLRMAATPPTRRSPRIRGMRTRSRRPRHAAKPKSQVAVWREGLDWSVLAVDYSASSKRSRTASGRARATDLSGDGRGVRRGCGADAGGGAAVEGEAAGGARLAGRAGAGPVHAREGCGLASRRVMSRIRWAKRRSTIHRLSSTTRPRMSSLRLTIAQIIASVAGQYSTEVAHPEDAEPHRPVYGGLGPPTLPRYRTPPPAVSVLATQAGAGRFTEVTWRQGSKGAMTSRFTVLTVRPAGKQSLARGPGGGRRTQPVGRCPARPDPYGRVARRSGRSDGLLDSEPARHHPGRGPGAVGEDALADRARLAPTTRRGGGRIEEMWAEKVARPGGAIPGKRPAAPPGNCSPWTPRATWQYGPAFVLKGVGDAVRSAVMGGRGSGALVRVGWR